MARVRQLGLVVLHPYGDSLTYDLGIEQRGRLLRVHVKSTTFQRGETYEINLTGPGGRRYKKGDLICSRCMWRRWMCGTSCHLAYGGAGDVAASDTGAGGRAVCGVSGGLRVVAGVVEVGVKNPFSTARTLGAPGN
jgi:hypothetical protein